MTTTTNRPAVGFSARLNFAVPGKPLAEQTEVRYSQPSFSSAQLPVSSDPVSARLTPSLKTLQAYSPVRFGGTPFYRGPFDEIKIISDFGSGLSDQTSNARALDRFYDVLQFVADSRQSGGKTLGFPYAAWTQETHNMGFLRQESISDIPSAYVNLTARNLLQLGARKKQTIFIHVTDPGVGVRPGGEHDRSILVSKEHGVYIGPNNGSLALIAARLQNTGETPKLYRIDFQKVQQLERLRENDPTYTIPETFHGRDVFAVVGGAIAGGLKPESLAETDAAGHAIEFPVQSIDFAKTLRHVPGIGSLTTVRPIIDKTSGEQNQLHRGGNVLLNVELTLEEFAELADKNPVFALSKGGTQTSPVEVPLKRKFSDVPKGELVLYLGSSFGTRPGTYLLELAVNSGNAAKLFGLEGDPGETVTLGRVS